MVEVTGLVFLIRYLLDAWYVVFVVNDFEYYPAIDFSLLRFFESILLTGLAAWCMPRHWMRPSAFYLAMLLLVVFLPMCVIYANADFSRSYMYVVALTVFMIAIVVKNERFEVEIANPKNLSQLIIVLMVIGSLYVLVWLAGLGIALNFDFDQVYIEREKLNMHVTGIYGYLLSWTGKIFLPALIAISIFRKSYIALFLLLVVLGIYFGLSTHKFFLVVGLLPLALLVLYQAENVARAGLRLMAGGMVLAGIAYVVIDSLWIPALTIQRPLFKPGLLNFLYADFFQDKTIIAFSNSVLAGLIEYPYQRAPAFLIGEYFKGDPDNRSNTGFLGTGYAHLGLIGPLLLGLAVAILLKLLDAISRGLRMWLVLSISMGPVASMIIAADFFPSLLTHGVLPCFLVIWALGAPYRETGAGFSEAAGILNVAGKSRTSDSEDNDLGSRS